MRIIKRSGEEQEFNPKKISVAIGKANGSVTKDKQFPENYIPAYTAQAVAACENLGHTPTVQEVQDIVEDVLMTVDVMRWLVLISSIGIRMMPCANIIPPMTESCL